MAARCEEGAACGTTAALPERLRWQWRTRAASPEVAPPLTWRAWLGARGRPTARPAARWTASPVCGPAWPGRIRTLRWPATNRPCSGMRVCGAETFGRAGSPSHGHDATAARRCRSSRKTGLKSGLKTGHNTSLKSSLKTSQNKPQNRSHMPVVFVVVLEAPVHVAQAARGHSAEPPRRSGKRGRGAGGGGDAGRGRCLAKRGPGTRPSTLHAIRSSSHDAAEAGTAEQCV